MSYTLRLLFFAALFTVLCVKGGELCSAGGANFLPGVFGEGGRQASAVAPEPLRPREEEFRGVSPLPLPVMSARLLPPKRVVDKHPN